MDGQPPRSELLISATEFKAKCLDILDRVSAGEWTDVQITKRGKVVGILKAPPTRSVSALKDWSASMAGSVVIPQDMDLTAPVLDDALDAESGLLHR